MAAQSNWEEVTLVAEGMAFLGECIARQEGKVVFVPYLVPGERARIKLVTDKRGYARGEVVEVLEASPDRVSPPCRYFGTCSGCTWQHIAYERQLELKREVVAEQLRRIGKLGDVEVLPTVPSPSPWEYRNHARFTVNPAGHLGYVQRRTRRFLEIEECRIMDARINRALARLQGLCTGETQVNVRVGRSPEALQVQPALKDAAAPVESGQAWLEEELHGRRFRISAPSFFQVNRGVAERLVDLVVAAVQPRADQRVLDVYAGVGTFGVFLAPLVAEVTCIEESAAAMADARLNVEGIGNIRLLKGRVEKLLPELEGPVDAAILDPSRTGCSPRVLEALARLEPARLVYVSCDPATLARDLRHLCDLGYAIVSVQPLDMFPQTYHVEVVTVLQRGSLSGESKS